MWMLSLIRQIVFALAISDIGSCLGANIGMPVAFCVLALLSGLHFNAITDAELESEIKRNDEIEAGRRVGLAVSRIVVVGITWALCRTVIAVAA